VAMRRGVGLVLAIVLFSCLASLTGLVAIYVLVGREPAVPARSTLVLRLSGDLGEGGPEDVFGQYLPVRRPTTVRTVVENLRKARVDPRISAVLVVPSGFTTPYWAKLQEVHDAIVDFRRSGKQAIAYMEYGGQSEYYVAAACDRIFMVPTSTLDLTGVASYLLFLRGTLDKIGAVPDMIHVGDYKTATNQLTEKTLTPAHREMVTWLNRDLYDQLVRAVADGRKKSEAEVRRLLDEGPFLPEDALRAGLVDDLAYEDQVRDRLKSTGRGADRNRLPLEEYDRVSATSLGLNRGQRIAVIYAAGTITSGRSGYDPLAGATVGSDTLAEYLRKVRDDSSIRAVVLRIDSPGGGAVASDVIWRELTLLRDQTPRRPLVVSMSDLAASGGYYIAMAAPTIVAEPGTLTGSIGIYGGKIATGGTYGKLGANIESLSIGRNAEIDSPIRPYTPEERAKVDEQLRSFYEQFVEKAAQSRHTTPERIDAIAQGRVWTGRQAKDLRLVDALGGLDKAVALAKEQAKIPASAEVELVIYPPRRTLYELISTQFGGGDETARLDAALGFGKGGGVAAALARASLFRRGELLALMPFVFSR
jgi:protease-4